MQPLPRFSSTAAVLLAIPGAVLAIWGILFAAGGLAPGASSLIAAGTTIPTGIVLGLIAVGGAELDLGDEELEKTCQSRCALLTE